MWDAGRLGEELGVGNGILRRTLEAAETAWIRGGVGHVWDVLSYLYSIGIILEAWQLVVVAHAEN